MPVGSSAAGQAVSHSPPSEHSTGHVGTEKRRPGPKSLLYESDGITMAEGELGLASVTFFAVDRGPWAPSPVNLIRACRERYAGKEAHDRNWQISNTALVKAIRNLQVQIKQQLPLTLTGEK